MLVVRLDVTDEASVTSAIGKGIKDFGGIDVVVFDVNLLGATNVCRAILPHLRERRAGVIINVSSAAGAVGLPLSSIYAASKFGLESFSEAPAFELLSQSIVVKLVEPGGMAGTKSFASSNRESSRVPMVPDYAKFMARAEAVFANMAGNRMNITAHVANVIFNAATDGSDQLRYVATDDIQPLLKLRREASEEELIASMRMRFPYRD